MVVPFALRNRPRANQSSLTPPVGERHKEQPPLERVADDDVTAFNGRVVGIVVDLREPVLKHRRGLLKGDAVLKDISRGLRGSHSNVGPALEAKAYRGATYQ